LRQQRANVLSAWQAYHLLPSSVASALRAQIVPGFVKFKPRSISNSPSESRIIVDFFQRVRLLRGERQRTLEGFLGFTPLAHQNQD
jgi:hypothetical protein